MSDMHTPRDGDRLVQLTSEFDGWHFGRGGSGRWWAVRGNDLVRAESVEELRHRVRELGPREFAGRGRVWSD
ncbi:hypothetical protein [Actinomadura harenae]|uniref:Uncharacterized protein n=1 Tax=Actinomadura harenae TaxID=2483351 RepID=A0A3M2LP40_9ACTN|nr:hypothetical protein [Actinomadura harenae]RMI39241.1 hypothetical protein EBO15_30280 [Actinomadura harenae]